MSKFLKKFIAVVIIAVLALAPVAGIAKAGPVRHGCGDIYLAVGGYPRPELVPPGYTPVHTPGGIFFWESGGYNHGQDVGSANVIRAVEDHVARCPTGKVHLFGHSYGAAIIHTAVEHIDRQPYAPRVHVHLTGNPRHPGGVEDSWRGLVLPGMRFRGAAAIPSNVGSFVDRCNPRDAICDMPPWYDPIRTVDHIVGYLTGAHAY